MTEDRPDNMSDWTRDGKGRFARDPETAAQDARAAQLRARSWTYQQIADELGISQSAAHDAVQRVLAATVAEPADAVRKLELERLDRMAQEVEAVLKRRHVTVSNGKVVQLDGEVIEDDGPILQAVDRLLKIQERRAKLLGLDAATKVSVDADNLGKEIGELLGALASAGEDAS